MLLFYQHVNVCVVGTNNQVLPLQCRYFSPASRYALLGIKLWGLQDSGN